ncbi:hypothetical protein DENSPDRAFT_814694 [Dentipellis sp. KUC8613]|nr:hypothetical protein DENSPDRAFT_814694 [Dentipellis sp. KUC8613]
MSPFERICALAVIFVSCLAAVAGSSASSRPLKRLAHPSTLAIEIMPRPRTHGSLTSRSPDPDSTTLHHSDSFRLTLTAFGSTFHLHLRPNEHLIHPSARIAYTAPDGTRTHTEPLLRSAVRAYWGEVVPAHASPARMREDAARVLPRPAGAPELGWARIVVHHQGDVAAGVPPVFEGAFSAGGVVHHVVTKENYLRNKHPLDPEIVEVDGLLDPDAALVVWRDSDVVPLRAGESAPGRMCGHDAHVWNTDPSVNPVLRKAPVSPWRDPLGALVPAYADMLYRRDDVAGGGMGSNFADDIGQTGGCPTSQKVVYMGVAADCEYTQHYGSQQNATTQILTVWNTASALYKSTYNVSLGIVELQIQNATCPSSTDPSAPWNVACGNGGTDLNQRLSLFSQWRGQKGSDGAGLWHLMSGCPSGSEVGVAWLGVLCQQSASAQSGQSVSGTAVTTAGRVEWQVVSHEIGHNFGAIHDCTSGCNSTSGCCPLSGSTCDSNSQFIMSPVAEDGEMKFSQCTLGNICTLIGGQTSAGKLNTSCLVDPDPNRQTISLQMCGNGIVESGEDCDPGKGSNSTCCDASTCKFRSGSQCDPANSPCCTSQCQFAPSSQVCRPAKDSQCDTAESCSGSSAACPADVFAANGKSCGGGGLACASGQCTSIGQQCQMQGASMNLKQACPNQNDKSCKVSCQDPSNADRCVVLDSTLVDGSPCGFGGTCQNGNCNPGSLLDTVKSWYKQNLQISIPVTIVAGIVVLIILWGLFVCVRRCCRGDRDVRLTYPSQPPAQRIPSYPTVPPLATMAPRGGPSAPAPAFAPTTRPLSSAVAPPATVPVALRPGGRDPNPNHGRSGSSGSMNNGSRSQWVDAAQWNGPGR